MSLTRDDEAGLRANQGLFKGEKLTVKSDKKFSLSHLSQGPR